MSKTTDSLITELRALTAEFSALLNDEGTAIRAAKFAHAIGMQDRKIQLHTRLNIILDAVKRAEKTPDQAEELRNLLQTIIGSARTNQSALDIGFAAIERMVGRIVTTVRRTLHKDTPRYTKNGAYHMNASKSLVLQTDRTA